MASNHHNLTTPKSIPTVIIYFSYFIFFFPYLFKFLFFISPLFLTTSLLFIFTYTFPHSNLDFLHSFLHNLRSKIHNNNDVAVAVDDNEFDYEFRDFELYKIVFRDPDDPPLITVNDDDLEDKYVVTEFEQQRKLETLFDELDRFESCTTTSFEMKNMNEIETRSQSDENAVKLQKLAPISDEYLNSVNSNIWRSQIGDETTLFEKNENEARSQIDDQNSVNSNSWRSESSRSYGSCGSIGDETETMSFEANENETRSYVGKVIGELQKLKPVTVSYSDEDQKTVRLNSTVAIELKKDSKTTSHVRKVVQRLEPVAVAVSVSGDDQKSFRSKSTAAIERKNNETTSHVKKMLQKLEPVPVVISFSGDDQKIVRSKSTAEIDSKSRETAEIGTKNNETTTYTQKVNGQQTTPTQIKKLKPMKTSNSREDEDFVRSNPSTVDETKNSRTTTLHIQKQLQKSISVEEQKPIQNTFTTRSNSWRSDSSSSFGSYGSMRKEKEWKRTLACKLFEERNTSNGEEGMDSLWEAYEDDNNNKNKRSKNKKKTMMMNKYLDEGKCEDEEDEDDEDEDEFMSNGQVCCLKALKLSTGKMNLGMGKPNLVKISKVFKGFGWLHHVGSKHSKKY